MVVQISLLFPFLFGLSICQLGVTLIRYWHDARQYIFYTSFLGSFYNKFFLLYWTKTMMKKINKSKLKFPKRQTPKLMIVINMLP